MESAGGRGIMKKGTPKILRRSEETVIQWLESGNE